MIHRSQMRLKVFAGAVTLALVILAVRVVLLTFSGPSTNDSTDRENVSRGPILDRRGITLARTEEASAIAIAPGETTDSEFAAQNLSRFLEMAPEEIVSKIYQQKDRKYFYLKRQVDNFTADRIMDLKIPGVHRDYEFRRVYPAGAVAGNLLGFVGRDPTIALSGLERSYHDMLGRTEIGEGRKGPTLYLTVDSLIQSRLEKEMRVAYESSGAKRAVGILMDLENGEILALASFPEMDPNNYSASLPAQRENWGIRLAYEPGSTVKILMAAILIKNRAVKADEKFFCNGEYKIGNVTVRCRVHGTMFAHGEVTLSDIITKSCNVGIIQAMGRIPPEKLYADLKALGFGTRTEVLPPGSGELNGYLPELADWVPSNKVYFPIGQGFSVTPLQLLRAAGSIANGGTLLRPSLARQIIAQNGRVLYSNTPDMEKNPFDPAVNQEVLKFMRRVVMEGTARAAYMPDLLIAGKTGTGQKSGARGYEEKFVASFLGFFPAQAPRYGGIILFDDAGEETGGSIAAPVFARFVQSIQPILAENARTIRVPDLAPLGDPNRRFDPQKIGDFKGLSAREGRYLGRSVYGLPVELNGMGYVKRQEPAPGTDAQRVKKIILFLEP